jgi:hypothetical protein
MKGKDLPNWEAFEAALTELREQLGTAARTLLFRGVGDSTFELTTTLERAGCQDMSFLDYYNLVERIRPAVETMSGVRWKGPDKRDVVEKSFRDRELLISYGFPPVPLYRYMVYLRHHGFPSPLLDWSRSPYVAAFFGFRNDQSRHSEKRSIYVYCEMPEGLKGGAVGEPTIHPIGPYVRSHPRHFRQQSDYTICGSFEDGCWHFHSHEKVLSHPRPSQDFLWKFDLLSTERTRVLSLLDEYNLNAFSLFDSEETLLEMMWIREHISKDRNLRM